MIVHGVAISMATILRAAACAVLALAGLVGPSAADEPVIVIRGSEIGTAEGPRRVDGERLEGVPPSGRERPSDPAAQVRVIETSRIVVVVVPLEVPVWAGVPVFVHGHGLFPKRKDPGAWRGRGTGTWGRRVHGIRQPAGRWRTLSLSARR